MGKMGNGFGSECHLLRYLGRHRQALNDHVRLAIGCDEVNWLDFRFDASQPWKDREWRGLEFLPACHRARDVWQQVWPQRGNPPNWDAVARASFRGGDEWLLVEAKAHAGELKSSCGAKEGTARRLIQATLEGTRQRLGVPRGHDWMKGYYQFCNRVAVLSLLLENGVPARLLFVYFTGDAFPAGRVTCPANSAEWQPALERQARHVGLPEEHPLADRIHKLFLPVCPAEDLSGR